MLGDCDRAAVKRADITELTLLDGGIVVEGLEGLLSTSAIDLLTIDTRVVVASVKAHPHHSESVQSVPPGALKRRRSMTKNMRRSIGVTPTGHRRETRGKGAPRIRVDGPQ